MAIMVPYEIKLIGRKHIDQDYYQFDFEKPAGFKFEEGQFGVFGFKDKVIEGRALRAYSLASSNEESFIRIATKIVANPSDFKKKMMEMKAGDIMTLNAPKGDFVYDTNRKGVFIAGGIGITPIRSMLLSKKRLEKKREDILIYSELASSYPFKEELDRLSGLEIRYAADVAPTQKLIIEVALSNKGNTMYYLSGSPGFVTGLKALLEQQGIKPEDIRHDVFTGY